MVRKRILNSVVLALVMLTSHTVRGETISASAAASLYEAETTYSIYRKGKNIGEHTLKININDTDVNVSVASKITIRVLKVPVFKFSYLSSEVWQNERLLQVDSVTTTNKKIEKATLQNKDGVSFLSYNAEQTEAPLLHFATNHWHIGAVEQNQLFNTIKGTLGRVSVQKIPGETLNINNKELPVTHYKYTGDIIADSWYDENMRWVKLSFLGSDGSQITYVINNP